MHQPSNDSSNIIPPVMAGSTTLSMTNSFCYLGSFLSNDAKFDTDINARLAKAASAFGRLSKKPWNDHGIRIDTKIAVYKAAVLNALLYGSESWVLYRHNIRKLNSFHMRCLRRIAHVKWEDKIPDI